MVSHLIGHGPGRAAPEAASSGCVAGAASVAADAVAPARVTAQKESAPAAQAAQSREQNEPQDSAADDDHKQFATLAATAAMSGCSLHRLDDGSFLLCKCGMSKELPCLRAVGDLLQQIGGAR